jgi:hypothetical protein
MHPKMSQQTREEVLKSLRVRYVGAGLEYRSKMIDQVVELLGYHRKAAIRALRQTPQKEVALPSMMGRPRLYEPEKLLRPLKAIWLSANQPCGKLLVAALPMWVPAYESYHRSLKSEVREQLLGASAATLDRLLQPVRARDGKGRSGTKPGSLLRQQIPVRGGMWDEKKAGFLEVDTVALCGGRLDDRHAWMLDGVDIATTWATARALENRGEKATLEQIKDMEASLPFAVLGVDSDNGGEFLNHHLLRYWQQRSRPVTVTRSRPYHKDDNAHIEQKNWTRIRQWFGYERYDNPLVVPLLNELCRGPWDQFLNYFVPTFKLVDRQEEGSRIKRIYDEPKTPLARVLSSKEVSDEKKKQLSQQMAALNPFALKKEIEQRLRIIDQQRQLDRC